MYKTRQVYGNVTEYCSGSSATTPMTSSVTIRVFNVTLRGTRWPWCQRFTKELHVCADIEGETTAEYILQESY